VQFPTVNDSLMYTPIQVIDRSAVRTDLAVRWPNDDFQFIDDAEWSGVRPSRTALRLTGLIAAGLLALAASSALAAPAEGAEAGAPEMRVAPAAGMPAGLFLD